MAYATLASCTLNQWALDFTGNLARIKRSILEAKKSGASYRVGPELEVPGYGCEDHFLEPDTFTHSWEAISDLLKNGFSNGILTDVGAPIMHRHVSYNCRVFMLNSEVVLIRPKMDLADDGNYREARWFRAWSRNRKVEPFVLPMCVRNVTKSGARTCPIGPAILEDDQGYTLASESCEELWTPQSPHIEYSHAGVDIVSNASASHHALRKLSDRVSLLISATSKSGGVYLYSNAVGCDGGRVYYDGSSLIALNGKLLAQSPQFTMDEVHTLTATVDLNRVVAYRASLASRGVQSASRASLLQSTQIPLRIQLGRGFLFFKPSSSSVLLTEQITLRTYSPQEEIAQGPACWLWDYLRRSGMQGYFLPISGGADSAAVAIIVASMCKMIVNAVKGNTPGVLADVRRIVGDKSYSASDPKDLCGKILHTVYLAVEGQSSTDTRERASKLCEEIGAWHTSVDISPAISAVLLVFQKAFGSAKQPQFKVHGGSEVENLALQNVQARVRMVLTYLFAQLRMWTEGRNGGLLVLGAGNVDEGLSGYMTKYDCSSADVNPIGGVSKLDLKKFLVWASKKDSLHVTSLTKIVDAPPSAELEPVTDKHQQNDEADMGMTYAELGWYGRLRKLERCGPYSMYKRLLGEWSSLTSMQIGEKVKHFFLRYGRQRHKMTTLTPSYHAESYGPDDNRHDLRQFLYSAWTWQFKAIDRDARPVPPARENGK